MVYHSLSVYCARKFVDFAVNTPYNSQENCQVKRLNGSMVHFLFKTVQETPKRNVIYIFPSF